MKVKMKCYTVGQMAFNFNLRTQQFMNCIYVENKLRVNLKVKSI